MRGFRIQDSGFRARFLVAALLLVTCHSSLVTVAKATTVTGTIKDAAGTPLASGTVQFQLSQEGTVTDPALLTAYPKVVCTVTAGAIGTCVVTGNDVISPAGTFYRVRILSAAAGEILPERKYTITGATWNIGTATPLASETVAATAYQTVQDEGSNLTQQRTLNFIGSGVTCADNGGTFTTDCTFTGGGGSSAFNDITTGTNTTATMTVGSGATLTFSGTGNINARRVNGVEFTNSESLGKIPIGQGDGTAVWADPLVQGLTAHDAAGATTNPVAAGGYASAAAPTNVDADGDIVRAWYLRSGAQVTNLVTSGTLYDARQIRALTNSDVVTGEITVFPDNEPFNLNQLAGTALAAPFDLDSGAGTQNITGVSWRKAASGGSVEFGTVTDPVRTDPTGTTTQPVSGTVTANAGTGPFPVSDNAGSLTVDAPVGTPVNVQIGDGTDTAGVTAAGALQVDGSAVTQPVSGTVTANAGTGDFLTVTGHTRNEAFKESGAIGGELDDTATVAATEGNVSPARITVQRAVHANLRNNAGTEIGTTSNPVIVTDDGSAILVDGSAVTQPVSGTVTANAGTGPFPVSDNAGSITVDAPTATPVPVAVTTTTDTLVKPGDSANNAVRVNVVAGSGSGTEYVEDDAAPANPQGGVQQLVRQDTPATLTSLDGDVVTQRGTNYGAAYTQIVTSSGAFVDSFGGSGGTAQADESAFTEGTTSMTPVGGVLNDTITSDPTEDQAAAFRITAKRALHTNLRNNAGTEIGTTSNPVIVTDDGAALLVDGSAVTQPVSGTVNIGTFPDNEPINVAQMNGVAVTMGNGASGTGVQRVTIASDSTGQIDVTDRAARDLGTVDITVFPDNEPFNVAQVLGAAPSATNPLAVRLTDGTAYLNHGDTTASSTITANGQSVCVAPNGEGTAGFQFAGTWTGTIEFQGRVNASAAYGTVDAFPEPNGAPVTSSTANGRWKVGASGYQSICATSTAWSSGTANVYITSSAGSTGAQKVKCEAGCGGGTQYAEDTAHVTGDQVTMAGVVQQSADTALSNDGDRSALQVDATGYLKVNVKAGSAGGPSKVDDAPFTVATDSVAPMGALANDTSPDSVNEGDVGAPRMSLDRILLTQFPRRTVTGTIVATNGEVAVSMRGAQSVGFNVSGTWTSTLRCEVSLDGAVSYTQGFCIRKTDGQPVTSVTSNGDYSIVMAGGATDARVRSSSHSSGTVNVQINAVAAAPDQVMVSHSTATTGLGDDISNSQVALAAVNGSIMNVRAVMHSFDGTTWDRARGDATDGLLVNLGTNNDVIQSTAANLNMRPDTSGATGAAPPARADFIGGLSSGATGGFLQGMTVCDLFVNVNVSTATTTLLVTGVSGRHVRICSLSLVTAGANNVALISGTGATCGTGTTGMNGGTTAASGWNFAANGGLTQGSGLGAINQTNATGDSVCVVTSAAVQLSGRISYTIY